jgi:hypothetical protein
LQAGFFASHRNPAVTEIERADPRRRSVVRASSVEINTVRDPPHRAPVSVWIPEPELLHLQQSYCMKQSDEEI